MVWNGNVNVGTEAAEIGGIVDVQQIGDLVLHEEAVCVDLVEIDEKDLLERGRRALEVVALDDQKQVVRDGRQVADRVRRALQPIEPLPARVGSARRTSNSLMISRRWSGSVVSGPSSIG